MKRCSLAAVLLVLASGSARAVTPEQVFNEMSHEMAECSVYFTIVTNGLQNSNDLALAERYERARDDAGAMALKLNKMAGLKDDVAFDRIKIAQKMMSDRIGGNTSNVSVLLSGIRRALHSSDQRTTAAFRVLEQQIKGALPVKFRWS